MGKQKKHGAKKFEEYYGKPYTPRKMKENNLFSSALCTGAAGTVPDVAHQNGLKGEKKNEK